MRRSHPQCSNDSSTAESIGETRLLHNQNAYCRNRLLMLLLVLCVVATSMCFLGANALAQGKSGSAGVWEGDVVAPKWTVHIRLLLKQDKTKLSGWIWETGPGDSVQSAELIGEQVDTSGFRIVTGGGLVYLGKFTDANTMTGVRPNGNETDKNIPRFPFRFVRTRDALDSDFPTALPGTNPDWNVFFTRFKSAVRLRDSQALSPLMVRSFDTGFAYSSTQAFLNNVDWRQLTKAVSLGVKPCKYKRPTVKEAYCAIDPHPCPNCKYELFVSFERGTDDQWRWASMLASGD
jgi:hypothetical protein